MNLVSPEHPQTLPSARLGGLAGGIFQATLVSLLPGEVAAAVWTLGYKGSTFGPDNMMVLKVSHGKQAQAIMLLGSAPPSLIFTWVCQ